MANEQNLKPFKKGHDPRRNLRGVPKDAIAMRKLIREIGAELIRLPKDADGNSPEVTRLYAKIRQMYSSRAPADSQAILKALAPGLLTDTVALTDPDGAPLGTNVIRIIKHADEPKAQE